ncbi:MAG: LPS export ABC transporter permease LptF [Candidatus Rickettsiella isopodorum]|jgi:lipopolysaccharide export system permease protein|nr:LPS export ABC transporter permease LptF [Gammaproteobacteria bacterium]MCH9754307.1 LPS export ABC transporter permease LptF [Gammaproteobacteria bacterium]MDD4892539.1 LPS export ABC transporter permease LptF [Candidatus Rickettsiella isopodorum]MDD5162117.1 LPS export ABC transporter permease LptF [Candidatus Rickettsiella isopodorum]MDQ5899709.1 lipopolysaccharide export system permease protein [Pseudomonadota bacterium]
MILFRYLTRELLASLSLITSLLFLILMSNEFVHYLNQVAGGKFAASILWKLIILESPRFLAILLPFSLFLSILFTYGRLYADYEMTVLNACGFSLGQLTRLSLPFIFLLTFMVAGLNLWLNPFLLSYRNKLLTQTGTAVELQTVQPGSFQQTNGGHRIIYVESVSADHKSVKNIFLAQTNSPKLSSEITPWTVISANSGYQMITPITKEPFFVAVNGKRYQGIPGQTEYYITQFLKYGIRIDLKTTAANKQQDDALSSITLWNASQAHKASYFSELQWRLSAPISILLLALLAIPLSRVNPRQGKYLHILPAIVIYIMYLNLLLVGRNWIENGDISYDWGLWWIHGLLILTIIFAWCYALGWNRVRYHLFRLFKLRQ